MKTRGAVAAGHIETARAARDVLEAGGTAFDAVIAAMWAACVAEPVLASLGGGGFLMARPAGKPPRLYDFFVETPLAKRPAEQLEFKSCIATFAGGVEQEFHGGYGAVATPGVVAGLFAVHRDLAGMPMADLAAPARSLARDGVRIDPFQHYVMNIVTPLLGFCAETRKTYGAPQKDDDDFKVIATNTRHQQPELAASIDELVQNGADSFYRGDLATALIAACAQSGGYLTADDLAKYRVLLRDPLLVRGRQGKFVLNPPPASGGVLAGFGLKLARDLDLGSFGDARHLDMVSAILKTTSVVRGEFGAAPSILGDEFCEGYRTLIGDRPLTQNGTTHISVVDDLGNLASVTLSNGSTSGRMIPGSGILLNNMLGEADLSPEGFHDWPCGVRMTSMMTPALYLANDGALVALGSGGSNRIRSTMMQVLLNLDVFGMSLEDAIVAPRMHFDDNLLSIEPGFDAGLLDRLHLNEQHRWQESDMFFGGVHAASFNSFANRLDAVGDARRNGQGFIID
ncbi:gamma-glutamyltransferase family protein [Thalassospira sp. TSL5-1]|uniref:gamma-glutamyltransferase family protein n=1 Tax=Thalassospira sp. TSL5-1 TaxID=1544451 RepID=UPI00093A3947|nr:gamma-glutamyltransferase [Thalassospira sp. TSL5-1]OKH88900.1 gamma-glutamyltransferase [Thalassospira sp. TSL5-1]